jgi:hypothetical protein
VIATARFRFGALAACAVVCATLASSAFAANFTSGAATAQEFGTHEIVLYGSGSVPNPFDTVSTVRFTPPSGPANAVTVNAFYDGGDTWRARVYVTEAGSWSWTSTATTDLGLDGKSGSFVSVASNLRGALRKHRANPHAWMTDDGRWFANVSDTAYRLFHRDDAPLWREFVRDASTKGIDCLRVASLGGWGGTANVSVDDNDTWMWNDPWVGGASPDYTRYDLSKFQNTDERIEWILDNYPSMYLQMILFGLKGYGSEATGDWWQSIPEGARANTMRYMIARWSAFPNVFWLIVNDMHSDAKYPKNLAFAREAGSFIAANDPYRHLLSSGPNRRAGFPFTTPDDLKWVSYAYIEDANAVGSDAIRQHKLEDVPLHVWLGEDYYEQDHGHYKDPRYFFRWLYWSWFLSGGSANYCGRFGQIHPYSMTARPDLGWRGIDKRSVFTGEQLVGLDSVPTIARYFDDRKIDLSLFQPNDTRVSDPDGRAGRLRPKLMERGTDEILIYQPNAAADAHDARVDETKTARLRVDLTGFSGKLQVEWTRALDGVSQKAGTIEGGTERDFVAPWQGQDVLLHLKRPERLRAGAAVPKSASLARGRAGAATK